MPRGRSLGQSGPRRSPATCGRDIEECRRQHPGIIKEPLPQAYPVDFAPDAVSFKLRVWTDRYEDWVHVRSDLAAAVDDALTREKITIA